MMPTATIRVIKGAPKETELAALIAVFYVLSHPSSAAAPGLTTHRGAPRRAPWTRPQRHSTPSTSPHAPATYG
ncbi:MAG: acyl-CoA carboxylase subunit epsilon [Pseudonocardiaceae bacterium]